MPELEIVKSIHGIKVLVVDDEDILAWSIETELRANGAEVLRAGCIREALDRFRSFSPDLAICDLRLPDGNGLELLASWKREKPDIPVIIITAHGAMDSAIIALRAGAFDYLQKPFELKQLIAAARRAAEVSQLRQKISNLTGNEKDLQELQIIGNHQSIKDLYSDLKKIAKSKVDTVLITGESGSGKELAARALHIWSTRKNFPFVEINCASIPESLLESELFGYEKGAFTDARERKLGLFEIAKSGTIFLDEIGEMPPKIQAKLLRALEYKRFKRLGGTKDIELNARIVAATNRNLLKEIENDRFRADLYYRLNVIHIKTPTLAERKTDIPLLTEHLLDQIAKDLELHRPQISKDALDRLSNHLWPGNVRELKNTLKRALVLHEPEILEPNHIELDILNTKQTDPTRKDEKDYKVDVEDPYLKISSELLIPEHAVSLDTLERTLLVQALERSKNNQTKAAKMLGITRHTLRYRLDKHGLLH